MMKENIFNEIEFSFVRLFCRIVPVLLTNMKQHRYVRLFIALIFAARPCLQITYSKNIEAPMKGKFWWVVTITLILYYQ